MSEDELMQKITELNEKIDHLCFLRDEVIEDLYFIRNKKKGTESDTPSDDLTGTPLTHIRARREGILRQ